MTYATRSKDARHGTPPSGRRAAILAMLAVAALSAALLLATQTPAQALGDEPPVTVLRQGNEVFQRGILGSNCWDSPDGEGGSVSRCEEVVASYPKADRVKAGSVLRVRIFEAEKPDFVSLGAYRKVDDEGSPADEGQRLRTSLRPVARSGRTVAWDVVFQTNRPDRHYYLTLFGRWEDEDGFTAGDAVWNLHVKTRGR